MRYRSAGLSLLEFLIVASCISLIAAVVVPAYQAGKARDLVPDLVQSASSRKDAIQIAIDSQLVDDLSDLDAGRYGIPDDVMPTATQHGAQVVDGRITMVWKLDSTYLQGTTYELTAAEPVTPVYWNTGGSCKAAGYC